MNTGMKRMTIRLDDSLYQTIKERALREHRSAHAEILDVLEKFFHQSREEESSRKPSGWA